ncbi:hypothetical protein [Gemmata sp.]|uniref:hypothetical protein n=1 Tax=Gemmata sp. TaxID=1914242 RepID=UPI003F70E56E
MTSTRLTSVERQDLLDHYRYPVDPYVRLRAHTRNHRCQTMGELLDLAFDWFATRTHFRVETGVY